MSFSVDPFASHRENHLTNACSSGGLTVQVKVEVIPSSPFDAGAEEFHGYYGAREPIQVP